MKTSSLLWLAAFSLVGGCGILDNGDDNGDDTAADTADTDTVDTDDTDVVVEDPTWNENYWTPDWKAFVDCSAGTSVKFVAETNNWGGDVQVYFAQTDYFGGFRGWDENHTMEETDHSAAQDGYSHYERTLTTGAAIDGEGAQVEDESTVWKCSGETAIIDPENDRFEVTFALAVWAPGVTSGDPTDCIVFGNDAEGLIADPGGNDRPNAPAWLTDTNCRAL